MAVIDSRLSFGSLIVTKKDGTKLYLNQGTEDSATVWESDFDSFTIADTEYGNKITWFATSYNGKVVYVPVYPLFLGINAVKYIASCNKLINVNNKTYRMCALTKDNVVRAGDVDSTAFKIPYELYHFGRNYYNNGICTIDKKNDGYLGLWYMEDHTGDYYTWDSRIYGGDSGVGHPNFRVYVYLIEENSAPVISGNDDDLGDKTSPFNITYSVSLHK